MLVFGLLFVWCPLMGIVVYAIYLCHQEEMPVGRLGGLAVMLSLYLGGLAVTKELLGDFLTYSQYFYDVPKFDGWSYIRHFGKEPFFYGYTYLSYYLFGGSWNLYVISITTMNYLLLSYAILKIGVALKASISNVVVALFFMAFFFQEFASIGNMLRQGLAQSMTVVFLVRWYVVRKRSWWLAILALGVHTSCLPVLCIGLLPVLRKRLLMRDVVRLSVLLVVLAGLFLLLGRFLVHLPFVGYIFERMANHEQLLSADSWQTEVGLQPAMVALLFLLLFMAGMLYRNGKLEEDSGLYVFINLNLVLSLMMVACELLGMYYLQMRYFFYLYAFQNTLFLIFLHQTEFLHKASFRLLASGMLVVYFFYNFSHNLFSYIPVAEAFVYPLPVYLFL